MVENQLKIVISTLLYIYMLPVMSDLKKFEQKHKESLMQNIWTNLSIGLDEFAHLMGFGKKSKPSKGNDKNRVAITDDKYENKIITQRK